MNISAEGSQGAFTWLASWLVMLLILASLAQTEWGKRIVYYVSWLAVLFLLVTHASEFTGLLGNFAGTSESSGSTDSRGDGPTVG